MKVTLGTAPDSWGVWFADDPRQTPWHRFLDEVAVAGYRWIELGPFGYLPTDLAVLRAELKSRDLRVSGTFVMFPFEEADAWDKWGDQVERTCSTLAALGSEYVILIDELYSDLTTGKLLAPADLDDARWAQLIKTTGKIADVAQRNGLKPVIHPHAETHVEFESQVERFLADADPRIGLCLDIGHYAYRGGDSISLIRRHHARIWYLHLKNIDLDVLRRVQAQGSSFAEAVGMGMFVEPSKGAVDFARVREVLDEVGYEGFGIVEQDMYPAPLDKPLPIAERTYTYLRSLGLG